MSWRLCKRSRGVALLILNLSTRWQYMVDMHWPLNPEERSHKWTLNGMLVGHHVLSGHYREDRNPLPLPGIKPWIVHPITYLLYWLHYPTLNYLRSAELYRMGQGIYNFSSWHGNVIDLTVSTTLIFKMYTYILFRVQCICRWWCDMFKIAWLLLSCHSFTYSSHRSMIDWVPYTCLCVDSPVFNETLQLQVSKQFLIFFNLFKLISCFIFLSTFVVRSDLAIPLETGNFKALTRGGSGLKHITSVQLLQCYSGPSYLRPNVTPQFVFVMWSNLYTFSISHRISWWFYVKFLGK